MDKPAIKKFAIWARNKLIADTKYRAGLVGVTETAVVEPLPQSNESVQFFDVGLPQPYRIEGDAVTQRQRFVAELNKETAKQGSYTAAYQTVVDKVAYTWFNRLIAVRYMEVNDLLPSRTRVLSSADGRAEPQIVTTPFDAVLDYTPAEQQQIVPLKNDNKLDEVFRLLFLKQCVALGDCLPRLFEQVDDYMPLLLALSFTDKDGVVCHLVNDIPESDWQDAVQIVGWLYQYYNTEPKEQVFANLKKNIKISKENIPAATQLFTPDWIVRYMVENSLGRLYVDKRKTEGIFADGRSCVEMTSEEIEEVRIENEKIIAKEMGWQYYLPEAMQAPEVRAKLEENANKDWTPESLRCIDPCMGSGHILAYLFDVLMQIYRSAGYTDRDAAASIVEHNLYGLDIDDRAAQMAYFVVMMKGCHYDSRFLRRHLNPHVYAIQESGEVTADALGRLGKQESTARALLDGFKNAKEYGSILQPKVTLAELDALQEQLREVDGASDMGSLTDQLVAGQIVNVLYPLIEQARMLVQKYDVVVTNPPYMGASNMNPRLNDFIKNHYPDYKSDFFSAFIVRGSEMTKPEGYCGYFTPYVWMFIQSYEKLREYLYSNATIETLIQFEYSAFEEATVPVCTFAFKNSHVSKKGCYLRLVDFRGGMEVQRQKTLEAIANHNCGFYYEQNTDNFSKIPGSPVAYSLSSTFIDIFARYPSLSRVATTRLGMTTADNNKFTRFWYEPAIQKCAFSAHTSEEVCEGRKKWVPYNKGGKFRKWYGNLDVVVNWENDGYEIKNFADEKGHIRSTVPNTEYYFKECATWSKISSGTIAFRYRPNGSIFDVAGACMFAENNLLTLMGFCNSCVAMAILGVLSPTMNYEGSHIAALPIKEQKDNPKVSAKVKELIATSKTDWDSFETSWDFAEHPLVKWSHDLWDCTAIAATMDYYYHGERPEVSCPVELCYLLWQGECNDRFAKLKANEEELNRIFIDIYGLQDELTPEVEDKDVTVRRADLGRDIRSLISYAVGCIFGRYSLDQPGLAYAGGDWNPDQYHTFLPDADNVIPITDEEYFPDDLTGLFVAWVKKVFGADSLEDNLAFIAKALGTKGTSPRAVIRNYFLNGFYADHVKIYQKRPIYWLYDSGKQNGFKALIYMHRYNADTSGLVRADYLYKMEQVYESEIARMDDAIANGASREVAQATKRKEKLVKQLKECKDYDDRLGHIALARIPIDLDDGVKDNYDKVQTGADGKKQAILAKI